MITPSATVGRPGGLGGAGGKRNWRDMLTKGLAWTSYVFGIASAALLASTFLGGIVDNIFSIGPDWIPFATLAILAVFVGIDLLSDFVPNRLALYCTLLMPSIARGVDGKLGQNVEDGANRVRDWLQGGIGDWLGTTSAIGLAIAGSGCAYLVARRTMKPKAG